MISIESQPKKVVVVFLGLIVAFDVVVVVFIFVFVVVDPRNLRLKVGQNRVINR